MYISESTLKKILKEAGAGRVSTEACKEFQKFLNKTAFQRAQKAVLFSKHARRKMIAVSDVRLACD